MTTRKIICESSSRGAYDFVRDGLCVVFLDRSHRAFVISDQWAGDKYEGKCYRPFFCEVEWDRAEAIVADAKQGRSIDNWNEFHPDDRRLSAGPVWLRRAIESAEVTTYAELTANMPQETSA